MGIGGTSVNPSGWAEALGRRIYLVPKLSIANLELSNGSVEPEQIPGRSNGQETEAHGASSRFRIYLVL